MRELGKGSTRRTDQTRPNNSEYVGRRRIVVAFDEPTFAVIRGLALDAGTSFAEQVRLLVTDGLTK